MAAMKKIAGLIAGVSAVAVFGVAVAQGVPPNPFVTNHALGAGQQSSHLTSMGETGVPALLGEVRTAEIVRPAVVAQVEAPAAIEPALETQSLGAAPAPAAPAATVTQEAAPTPTQLAPRADRG